MIGEGTSGGGTTSPKSAAMGAGPAVIGTGGVDGATGTPTLFDVGRPEESDDGGIIENWPPDVDC